MSDYANRFHEQKNNTIEPAKSPFQVCCRARTTVVIAKPVLRDERLKIVMITKVNLSSYGESYQMAALMESFQLPEPKKNQNLEFTSWTTSAWIFQSPQRGYTELMLS